MKVTMRLLIEGANLTLAQDLKTEFRLSQRFIHDKDFYEGVRAGRETMVFVVFADELVDFKAKLRMVKWLDTCYNAAYMSQTQVQQGFPRTAGLCSLLSGG